MQGDTDDDWIPTRSIFDDEEDDESPGDDARDLSPLPTLRSTDDAQARTAGDWLENIRWADVLSQVVAAERAITALATRLHASSASDAWVERALLEEAVSDTRIAGLITTRPRVRIVLGEHGIDHAGVGDMAAAETYRAFVGDQRGVPGLYSDGVPTDITGSDLVDRRLIGGDNNELDDDRTKEIVQRHHNVMAAQAERYKARRRKAYRGDPDVDEKRHHPALDATELAESLNNWLAESVHAFAGLPRVVHAAGSVWLLYHSDASDILPGLDRFARTLVPVLLSRAEPQRLTWPVPVSRGFVQRPQDWTPASDPTRWLERFAQGVTRAVQQLLADLSLVEKHLQDIDANVPARRDASAGAVATYLAVHEVGTVEDIRRSLGFKIRPYSLRRVLQQLSEPPEGRAVLAKEISGRQLYTVWAHPSIQPSDIAIPFDRRTGGSRQQTRMSRKPDVNGATPNNHRTIPAADVLEDGKRRVDEALAGLSTPKNGEHH